jgi:hypothetical protein
MRTPSSSSIKRKLQAVASRAAGFLLITDDILSAAQALAHCAQALELIQDARALGKARVHLRAALRALTEIRGA